MACIINDVQWRLGNYVDRTLPAILGREAASIIEAGGSGVTTLQVGQPVMARAPIVSIKASSLEHSIHGSKVAALAAHFCILCSFLRQYV